MPAFFSYPSCPRNSMPQVWVFHTYGILFRGNSCLTPRHGRRCKEHVRQSVFCFLRNPGRDISFPIFTRKEVETKRIGKEIKTIISRLNDLSSFLSNTEQNRNSNKKIRTEIKTTNISFKQLIIFLFQPSAIFFGWLHQPMAGQDYIDLTRYYVVKSRYLSCITT